MVKHTQVIRWQQPTNCLSLFEHIVGFALKGLRVAPILAAPIREKEEGVSIFSRCLFERRGIIGVKCQVTRSYKSKT